jgi:hypothetical protein
MLKNSKARLGGPFLFSRPSPEFSVISVRGSGMHSVGGSVTMNYYDVLQGAKKQRTRVTLRYRIVTITAAYELLGSTLLVYCILAVKVKE